LRWEGRADKFVESDGVRTGIPGDKEWGQGGSTIRHKRGWEVPRRHNSKISWTQVETGSATPGSNERVILSRTTRWASFIRWALTNILQQGGPPHKMIHLGRTRRSTILQGGHLGRGPGRNLRVPGGGRCRMAQSASGKARNPFYQPGDSWLRGATSFGAAPHFFLYIEVNENLQPPPRRETRPDLAALVERPALFTAEAAASRARTRLSI